MFYFVDPVPQPADYHEFADARVFLRVPNFWNVASNLPFLIFGIAGIRLILTERSLMILPSLRHAWIILFIGITLTAFGSGWFHLAPRNDTLYWDRLPMTIAFMPLLAIIIGEHVSERLAAKLTWPLLFIGISSVLWWDYTESIGAGDLRLYGLVQFLPMLLIPAVRIMYQSVFDTARFYWIALMLYALAKIFEQLDGVVFGAGELISGHSIKHVVASLVPIVLIHGLRMRRYRESPVSADNQITS